MIFYQARPCLYITLRLEDLDRLCTQESTKDSSIRANKRGIIVSLRYYRLQALIACKIHTRHLISACRLSRQILDMMVHISGMVRLRDENG